MTAKKISPKVQLAAEKYLASLGSSREQLTDKQWEAVTNYVKKPIKTIIIFLLIFGVVNSLLCFWAFKLGKKAVNSMVPNETREIVLVSKSGEKSLPIEPDEMKNYLKVATKMYWYVGANYILTLYMFSLVILVFVERRVMRKMLEAFIPHAGETKTTSLENK